MTKTEYESLISTGTTITKDGFGIKVVQLPDQRILKLFRRKRLLSSQLWRTHASRFCRNARILQKCGVPTIEIESVIHIPEMHRQGVLYKMLDGDTLRDWLSQNEPAAQEVMFSQLGTFVAHLHHKGILFRSLHLANVVVMPNHELGLIDIADLGFRRFGALSISQRIRNFHHMDRNPSDRQALAGAGGAEFMKNYLETSKLSATNGQRLVEEFDAIFTKYRDETHV